MMWPVRASRITATTIPTTNTIQAGITAPEGLGAGGQPRSR